MSTTQYEDAYKSGPQAFNTNRESDQSGGEESYGFGQFLAEIQQKQELGKKINIDPSELNYFL